MVASRRGRMHAVRTRGQARGSGFAAPAAPWALSVAGRQQLDLLLKGLVRPVAP